MKVGSLQLGQKLFDFGFSVVLARLLVPADFGVVAAASLFILLAQLLTEIGVGSTIIQSSSLSVRDLRAASTIVYVNAFIYAILIFIFAPLVQGFMRIDGVELVLRILSLQFILQAPGIVPEAILLRRFRAAQVAVVQFLTRVLLSGSVGIVLAYVGWGYWALVASTLVGTASKSSITYLMVRPPAVPLFEKKSWKNILGRGAGFSTSRIINFAAVRGDNMLVGRYFDASTLGIYSRAYNLMNLPADLYSTVVEKILFPAMSSVQNDVRQFRWAFLTSVEFTATIGLPVSAMLYMIGPEIVTTLFGRNWSGVIPLYQTLAVVTYFRLGMRVAGMVQRSAAATRSLVLTQALYAILVVGGCIVAHQYGVRAVAFAVSAGVFVIFLVLSAEACRLTDTSMSRFVKEHRYGAYLTALIGLPAFLALEGCRIYDALPLITIVVFSAVSAAVTIGLFLLAPAALIGPSLDKIRQRYSPLAKALLGD